DQVRVETAADGEQPRKKFLGLF
ncbi:MAG: hypothetical protein RLZZ247_1049, partial [Cyanobacteriota bacterium]